MDVSNDCSNCNVKYLYSIRDKRGTYGNPCVFDNDKLAVRSFGDMVMSDDGLVHRHPEDFDLYLLARWDCGSGLIEPIEERFLVCASDFSNSGSDDE